ncbi:MAG: 2-hydroxychromene-2-carboxylate isomerase [Rhodobacteraceae bacterium]|nr:2-hydroxychromene-2-carboxylate isomerase [Paracoccaceae bacterium]
MPNIDYFMFTLSPFTYLAGNRLEEIAQKHGCGVTYKPFALMKVFEQTGGTPPAQRHDSRKAYRMQELARVARKTGMPINLQPAHFPTNPAPSCYAIIAAQAAGGGDLSGLTRSILRACWAEEKDIAEDAVIAECLTANGFDPGLAMSGLLSGAQEFEANTEEAVQRNVFGAPSYLVDDQVFWGQDRLDYLDDYFSGRG